MDVERLTVDLRPRPHWQAIDLGFALLRRRLSEVLIAWWIVWTPLVLLAAGLAAFWPSLVGVWLLIPWFVRPLFERLVVHILSREVFGERVTGKEALRAWKGTWSGGMIRVLTWWRLWALGRSFLQPIWQLEGLRDEAASHRRQALSRHGAGKTAFQWGLVCVHIELVLWMSILTLFGLFTRSGSEGNPFRFVFHAMGGNTDPLSTAIIAIAYGLALGVVGPFYAACGFTLYLNRRAELEAWDIELALRKLCRRIAPKVSLAKTTSPLIPLLLFTILLATSVGAAPTAPIDTCSPPSWWHNPAKNRPPTQNPVRIELRREVDSLYRADQELRGWTCEETWVAKPTTSPRDTNTNQSHSSMDWLGRIGNFLDRHANLLVWSIVLAALGLVGWIAWKYRNVVDFGLVSKPIPDPAPSPRRSPLPPGEFSHDPTDSVLALWERGSQREALGLLYRHACRHATERQARLPQGFSEGAMQRLVGEMRAQKKIPNSEADLMVLTTQTWSSAAWANQWPETEVVAELCHQWRDLAARRFHAS